jgi:adenosylhomocysteine nucleosidase
MNKIVFIVAVVDEAPKLLKLPNVYLSGLGKINAARSTTDIIIRERPNLIVNFGTAGGITVGPGLHRVSRIVQRDMNCQSLGFEVGVTPFDEMPYEIVLNCDGVTCGTGDNFVSGQPIGMECDVVDMEAYSIAKVCQHYQVPFASWKWISDSADDLAGQDWTDNNHLGQDHYIEIYKKLLSGELR